MKHNYLSNTPLEDAKANYFDFVKKSGFKFQTEKINSQKSNGRILAAPVYAKLCSPHYNASAMDGVAVWAEDTYGASEINHITLDKEHYTEVDTGDALPENTDAVIMVEDILSENNGEITINAPVHPWQNVRQVGEDLCMGDMIASSYTKITPYFCGAFLAGGVKQVEVIKKPVFGIIPTGDEIIAPDKDPEKGEILEFNSSVFSAMLSEWGADSIVYDIVPDKKELLTEAVKKAKSECDCVLLLAGSSAGRDDYTSEIVSSLGTLCVHGIAVKPGKPAILGAIDETPVIGLPGYPVSAIVIMNEIVKELVGIYYNVKIEEEKTIKAVLGKRVVSSLKYREYIRVTLGKIDGKYIAVPLPRGAGIITSFTKALGVIEIPQNCEGIEQGDVIEVKILTDEKNIENALIITGSHDPIIDEIADILKKKDNNILVTSSHVGSMGAIDAIKSGRAHLGAIHLLDEKTGEYNQSYIDKYFPNGGVVLKKGVKRIQGLMVAKGNPLNINKFEDIVGHRYVSRQRGSGTRILCDYLIKKYNMNIDDINGYDNEEFTHTAVAANIKAGNADVGLGIYSAAKMYDLDFIPICDEEYDFLIDEKYIDSPLTKAFLSALDSDEFIERIELLGGYSKEK
ncbi:MAG: molybdopterin biosynthesis protein [Clostridia bacterium]|nr:molybdopterin biosynthesis protein [Clostridia bacterium]